MKTIISLLILIQFYSIELKNSDLKIYKDMGKVNRSYEITIESFWTFKKYDIDSVFISDQKIKLQFYDLYKKSKKTKISYVPFMNPKFAIIGNFSGEIDTLYLDSEYRYGFLSKRKVMIEHKKKALKSFFKENNKVFFD
jgi:hypothetical protein